MNALKAYKKHHREKVEEEREKTLEFLSTLSDDELKEWSDKQFANYEALKQQLIDKGIIK